jgi:hypothetical protein
MRGVINRSGHSLWRKDWHTYAMRTPLVFARFISLTVTMGPTLNFPPRSPRVMLGYSLLCGGYVFEFI